MAEQRPYRLSGTASDASLRQTKIVAMLALGVAFVVVNWMTTQHAARLFGYSRALGEPWGAFPMVGSALPSVGLDGLVVALALGAGPRTALGSVCARGGLPDDCPDRNRDGRDRGRPP